MAETDFNDLLNAAEQLASEVDGTGKLPRVERTLRQVLEASQDLWARVATTGAQEIQANLLLGSKGVDLPQLSQKLESLSSKKTFEPLEPIPDTDIESYLKNETENAILSLIDSTHTDTYAKLKKDHKEQIQYEWEVEKLKLMSSMLGEDGKDYADVPMIQERTVLNESVIGSKSFMNSDEVRYARAIIEYHTSIIEGGAKPNLVDKFAQISLRLNDQMVNEMWTIVKYMTQIPPQCKGDPIEARSTPIVKKKMILQARSYLENRYRLYMSSVIQTSLRDAHRGGEPGTFSLVNSFVRLRLPERYSGMGPIDREGPLWPLVYYCLRCGDIQAATKCMRQSGPGFEEISKVLELKTCEQHSEEVVKLEKLIRTQYKRSVCHEADPYKRVIFSILGGCDVNEEHTDIVKTADDYLWLKLNQVCEEERTDENNGFECLSYSLLQTLVIDEYGEGHYNASEQPHVYFQLLFLTGQWEAAIDFLMRNDKLRVHGVHVAIVLHDLDLLALPADVKSPLMVVNPTDPKPMHRLNFARLIMIYVHKFENQDILEALHYYFCLSGLKTLEGDNVFSLCVSELVMKTREFERVLGRLELDGCRSPGLIDKFRGNRVDVDQVIDRVAQTAEMTGQYEDAIKLYDLAAKHGEVLHLMSSLLSQVVSRIDSEPGSLRSRLSAYAENITNRYAGVQLKCSSAAQATFYTLRDLVKFFDLYAQKKYPEALDAIQRSHLIPLSMDEVDERIKVFHTLSESISRNIPDVLLATMNMVYAQYTKIKGDSQSTSRAYFADSLKEQLSFLRGRAKALASFAGTVPYRMPGETYSRLVQMETLMH